METRLPLPFPAKTRLALPPHVAREIHHYMAARKTETPASKARLAAVDARLRAMVEDVERWPLPAALLKVVEELDGGERPDL